MTGGWPVPSDIDQFTEAAQRLEAVSEFAGRAAHDLANQISVISWAAEMLAEESPAGSPLKAHAERIRGAATKAGALTERMALLAQATRIEPQPLAMAKTVAEGCAGLEATLAASSRLALHIGIAEETVLATPEALLQVISELVMNAREAAGSEGRVTVELALAEASVDGPYGEVVRADDGSLVLRAGAVSPAAAARLRLRVRDSGRGMAEAVLAQSLEPFFTTKQKGQGAGMGLAIVQAIACRLGAELVIRTRPEAGTSVDLLFPAA
jgi:two-component system cell cycle sensor histidine kinase/response regulator CckA